MSHGPLEFSLYISPVFADTGSIGAVRELSMSSYSGLHTSPIVPLPSLILSCAFAAAPLDADSILKRMESAYTLVEDYQQRPE